MDEEGRQLDTSHLEKILDVYWPVIEEARKVRDYYGGVDDGVLKICPDVTGEMITAINKAEKQMNVRRQVSFPEGKENPDNGS